MSKRNSASIITIFLHFGLAFIGVISAVLVIGVNTTRHVFAAEALNVNGTISEVAQEQLYYFDVPLGVQNITVNLTGDGDADYDINYVCDASGCGTSYNANTLATSTETISIDNPEAINHWQISVYLASGTGNFNLVVNYTYADAVELLSSSGNIEFGAFPNDSDSFNFSTTGNYKNLFIVVTSQPGSTGSFDLAVDDPTFNTYYNTDDSQAYKILSIANPAIGDYILNINATSGISNYYVQVFTQDYVEPGSVTQPTISNSFGQDYANAGSAASFNLDLTSTDNLIVVTMGYKTTNYASNYVIGMGDSETAYSFQEACRTNISNFQIVTYYAPRTAQTVETVTLTPFYQGSTSNITQLYITAYGISNSGGVNLPLTDQQCTNGHSSFASLNVTSKTNDLLIGSLYSASASSATTLANTLYSNSTGSSLYRVASSTGDTQNISFNITPNVDWAESLIAIRPYGTIYSTFSTPGGGGGGGDITNPTLSFTTSPGSDTAATVNFEGTVTDDVQVDTLTYNLDAEGANVVSLTGPADSKSFTFSVSGLTTGAHSIVVTAYDSSNNTDSQTFNFNVSTDTQNPVLDFTTSPGLNSRADVHFVGTLTDETDIGYAEYYLNAGDPVSITLTGGTTSKSFDFNVTGLSTGSNQVIVYGYDGAGNSISQTFNFSTDAQRPTCDLPHQAPLVHSNTVTYTHVLCTDNIAVTGVDLNVYHAVFGDLYARTPMAASVAEDGAFDEPSEYITFTMPVELLDGNLIIQIFPTDAVGNTPAVTINDYFTVEAHDDTAPTVNLDEIRPDPSVDDSPFITGSCGDLDLYDTNTNIADMQYRIDGGSWTALPALDGSYGDQVEKYSLELSVLSSGEHTVDVQCTDAATHSATASDTFTIMNPVPVAPAIVTKTEDFSNHVNQSLSETNLVWGNGRLRLRENITTTRTQLDGTNFLGRYDYRVGKYLLEADPLDTNRLWYSRNLEIASINLTNNSVTVINPSDYGVPPWAQIEMFTLGAYQGKVYLWVSDGYTLYLLNITDGTGTYFLSLEDVQAIAPDFARNRMGAYLKLAGNNGSQTQIGYLDLNNTLENNSDDVFQFVPTTVGMPSSGALIVQLYAPTNTIFANYYGTGLYKWSDNNTPFNFADDQLAFYADSDGSSVFSMLVDPNGKLIYGTAGNQTGGLYVVDNDGGTPFNVGDDTIIQLANPQKLNNLNVYGLSYLQGQNGIGDQIVMQGEIGDAYYLNYNNTYSDLLDDTFIRLDTLGDNRGAADIIVKDYNTIYAVIDRGGLYRVALNRGWQNSGQAVIYSNPEDRLVTNYFELVSATEGTNISLASDLSAPKTFLDNIADFLFPKVKADGNGISYSVSSDGGVTWSPISLAEVVALSQSDYRVKFRVEFNQVSNTSPVLNEYTLAFGAYQNDTQAHTYSLNLAVVPSSVTTNENFTLVVKVIDELGFTNTSYNGTLNLGLLNTGNSTQQNNLLNTTTVNIVNGEATVNNAKISATGTYRVTSEYNSTTYTSNVITVSTAPVTPQPQLSFTANKTTINAGETVTLTWSAQNLTTLSINRGIGTLNTLSGSTNVAPTTTTVYTLSGTGSYGSLEASVTVVVNQASTSDNGSVDADNDGLTNDQEATLGTNPNDSDSDDDGLLDGEEVKACLFTAGTTTCSTTTFNQTDPLNPNTDGDSLLDGEEVKGCYFKFDSPVCSESRFTPTDPTDSNSPAKLPVGEVINTSNPTPTNTEAPATVEQPNIVTTIATTISNTAKSGTLPAALVATTAATTVLTATAYPNFVAYAFVWVRRKKKNSTWGLVFDTTNNKPVPFVTVRLLNESGKFIAEEITDINGKYAIVAKPGQYILEAKVNDFEKFDTQLTLNTESVTMDIALMPKNPKYDWKVQIRNWLKTNLPKINAVIFFVGAAFALLTLLISPNVINAVILVIFVFQIAIYYWINQTKTGKVFDVVNGKRLKGVLIRIFSADENRQIGSVSTNNSGMYNVLLKKGKYIVKVESREYQMAPAVSNLKDAVGSPYLEVNMAKEGLLNLEIPMERKTQESIDSTPVSKFGYLGN